MPFSRIDSTSPSSPAKSDRGWYWLGWIRSTSSIRSPGSGRDAGGSGMRLLSPLPSACLFMMADHLAGQVEVGLRSLRTDVIKHDGPAEGGGLPQPDVPWNDRLEHLLLEELADVVDHLARQVRPL